MSRSAALKRWQGRQVVDELARSGIIIRTRSMRGVAEEAPGAYKDVQLVAASTEKAGLARRVAELRRGSASKGDCVSIRTNRLNPRFRASTSTRRPGLPPIFRTVRLGCEA